MNPTQHTHTRTHPLHRAAKPLGELHVRLLHRCLHAADHLTEALRRLCAWTYMCSSRRVRHDNKVNIYTLSSDTRARTTYLPPRGVDAGQSLLVLHPGALRLPLEGR